MNLIIRILLCSGILFWSCSTDTKKQPDNIPVEMDNVEEKRIPEVSFSHETVRGMEDMKGPLSRIYLEINGTKHLLEEESIPSLGKPTSPADEMMGGVASTGAWYAGFGVNYSAFLEDGEVIVKKEVIEEIPEEMIEENPDLAAPQIETIKAVKIGN